MYFRSVKSRRLCNTGNKSSRRKAYMTIQGFRWVVRIAAGSNIQIIVSVVLQTHYTPTSGNWTRKTGRWEFRTRGWLFWESTYATVAAGTVAILLGDAVEQLKFDSQIIKASLTHSLKLDKFISKSIRPRRYSFELTIKIQAIENLLRIIIIVSDSDPDR